MNKSIGITYNEFLQIDGMLFYIDKDKKKENIVKVTVNKNKLGFQLEYECLNKPSLAFNENDFDKLYLYTYSYKDEFDYEEKEDGLVNTDTINYRDSIVIENLGNGYSIVIDNKNN